MLRLPPRFYSQNTSDPHSRIVVSRPPLASVPPSGLQARASTRSVCPTSVCRQRPLAGSHSLTVLSQLALARMLPSGAKVRPRTRLVCPESVCTQVAGSLCPISQSRVVPATSPLASRRPSGLQEAEKTGPGCGMSSTGVPSEASQSRTVASTPPLASSLPSGEKARHHVPCVCQPDQSKAPLSTSHSLTLPSLLPLASVCSSGLKARAYVVSVWACQARCRSLPSSRHTRTSPRLLIAAQYCPLRLMVIAMMASKASVKTHSRITAPDRFASCISTPCKYAPRMASRERSRPRRSLRNALSRAITLAGP